MKATASASSRQSQQPEDRIRLRAYFLWLEDNCPEGEDLAHWFTAEQELLAKEQAAVPKNPRSGKNAPAAFSIRHTLTDHQSDPAHRFHTAGAPHDDRLDVIAREARQRVRGRRFDNSLRSQPKSAK